MCRGTDPTILLGSDVPVTDGAMKQIPATAPLTLATRVSPALKAAVDAWREAQPDPKPTRAEALKLALTDWLTGMGYLRNRDDPEEATDDADRPPVTRSL